jgi:hypothetical protein
MLGLDRQRDTRMPSPIRGALHPTPLSYRTQPSSVQFASVLEAFRYFLRLARVVGFLTSSFLGLSLVVCKLQRLLPSPDEEWTARHSSARSGAAPKASRLRHPASDFLTSGWPCRRLPSLSSPVEQGECATIGGLHQRQPPFPPRWSGVRSETANTVQLKLFK